MHVYLRIKWFFFPSKLIQTTLQASLPHKNDFCYLNKQSNMSKWIFSSEYSYIFQKYILKIWIIFSTENEKKKQTHSMIHNVVKQYPMCCNIEMNWYKTYMDFGCLYRLFIILVDMGSYNLLLFIFVFCPFRWWTVATVSWTATSTWGINRSWGTGNQ